MAIAFGASVLNGTYTKECTITALVGDSGDLAVDISVAGMTDFAAGIVPIDYEVQDDSTASTAASTWSIHTVANNGDFTIRKSNAGAGTSTGCRVTLRAIHSIDR